MKVSEAILSCGAAHYGVDPQSFKSLGGMDGAVYACRKGSRAHVMKFTPMEAEKLTEYEEKLDFIFYLAQGGVPIATPLESLQGRRYELTQEEGRQYVVTLMNLVDGRHPEPRNLYDWNERLFQCWGAVMGKMHALTQAYPHWQKDETTRLSDWQDEQRFFAGWCKEPKIVEKWMQLGEELAALPRERDSFGLVHNDLHNWNFLYNPDAREGSPIVHDGKSPITIIDFDVCAYQWFMTDIAIPVYHSMIWGKKKSLNERETFVRQFMTHFMHGYQRENHLDSAWLERLPIFLRYREILIYVVFSNEWPEDKRQRWQGAILAERRSRILRGEPIIRYL
jgi:Ser/Thr protein kinase RdoA (MazF antagonist)